MRVTNLVSLNDLHLNWPVFQECNEKVRKEFINYLTEVNDDKHRNKNRKNQL
jgi:hypothetical protein